MVKKRSTRKLNVYSNLSHQRKTKKDAAARKKAEYLASLPKHPVKRILYRLHPKRFWGYWFSKRGAIMALKIAGVGILFCFLLVGGLFAYYRKDLDSIRPSELAKNVQSTVTRYYDRNGVLLWEDKGTGNYKLVVEGDEISDYMKKATVAIEDKDFYHHHGVSISGTLRAFINNATGGDVQGGSTLTQQLVKQVFFADESADRSFGGVPRKIKEAILAIEVERMYDKDQILNLYLNESPYGGRRNGVESASQTYFGKHAKNLTLAQAALLAAIPQNPAVYDPYNTAGNDALIARQHTVLNAMVDQGMITQDQADQAKKEPVLDKLVPEKDQYAGIKAPHFVQMVRSQLETELGKSTVGSGGLTVTTTLDYRIQKKLEQAMKDMFNSYVPAYAGFDNGAGTLEDVKTGQILALDGSRDFNYPGYGQDNAATSFIQPGSSVKPLVYAKLFEDKGSDQQNFGSGSILKDENIDSLYGAHLQNDDLAYLGNVKIRQSLATSRNVPAVKAMAVSGVEPTLDYIRAAGDKDYCTQGVEKQAGLSSAIGGCGTRQIDHVNAFATLADKGVYKPQTSIISVKNSEGETLQGSWDKKDTKQVISPQSAYIVSDILSDAVARRPLFGNITQGFVVPGAKTATKTGTTDLGGEAKDLWMVSYSPVLSMAVWLGNHTTKTLLNGNSTLPGPIISTVMGYAHELYAKEGKYTPNSWYSKPNGIQTINGELYPSWYSQKQGQSSSKMTFDKISKRKATKCTPESTRIELDIIKSKDPVTKKDIVISPSGYDATKEDNVHKCGETPPTATVEFEGNYIVVTLSKGDNPLDTFTITINGSSKTYKAGVTQQVPYDPHKDATVTVVVHDKVGESDSVTVKHEADSGGNPH